MVDPVTFEILRHRFLSVTREGFITLRNVSGSPSVAQSNDCNIALLDKDGDAFTIGHGTQLHALNCAAASKYVKQHFSDNPGTAAGDMFLSNDPYICTPHQTCAVVVAPFFHDDRLVAWTGAGLHLADVGGPTPGQVSLGAQSIWDEAMPMPPVKIVERDSIRTDIEQAFLKPSRTRQQNSLDLRAKISANKVMQAQLREIVQAYGVDTLEDVIRGVIKTTETRLRAILRMIPDGSWSETTYLDYVDRGELSIYECHLVLTKQDETLTFDFSGSSPQAPAVVNATRPGLEGNVLRTIASLFGFTVPACPAGIFRVCRIIAEPGTIVNCEWPAGACKGTTSATVAIYTAVTSCLSQMMTTAEPTREHAITGFRTHMALFDFSGPDQYGQRFAGVFTDCGLAAGAGARRQRDGIDVGAGGEPEVSIPNVESNELRYPIMYLYRRQAVDSGGAGKFRGGVGVELAVKPHGVKSIPDFVLHSHGIQIPNGSGQAGGYPHTCNLITIVRGSGATASLKKGMLPQGLDDFDGRKEVPLSFMHTQLDQDDVFSCTSSGGGGWGDPLERDPRLVMQDLEHGLVTEKNAKNLYGVVVDAAGSLNVERTARTREQFRAGRQAGTFKPSKSEMAAYLTLWQDYARHMSATVCERCSNDDLSKPVISMIPWDQAGPYYGDLDRQGFSLLAWSCPKCKTLLLTKPNVKVPVGLNTPSATRAVRRGEI